MAHIHLILNHIPLVAIPIALVFLVQGILAKSLSTVRMAYIVLMAAAFVIVPVFLTGEPAEALVEHLPGVTETLIEPHEEAATVSMILTLLAGISALWALREVSSCFEKKLPRNVAVVTSLFALASLSYTANLGGKIRHTELREGSIGQSSRQDLMQQKERSNEEMDD